MRRNFKTASLEESRRIVLDAVTPLGEESINILEAINRILYEDIVSEVMIPPMDCSAMDGYAVIAADTEGASPEEPARLKVIGEIQAGGSAAGQRVSKGSAIRIMTGAPMPAGADTVSRFEETEEQDGWVKIFAPRDKHDNYRARGESIKKGETVLSRGGRLTWADVGILASLNHQKVVVYRRPTVAIISTGDELAGIGEEVEPGKIRDVNAYALYSELTRYTALPRYMGIARDTLEDVRAMVSRAMDADVIIATGGGSMGKYDFVKEVYAELKVTPCFERVKVKPGKPCSFGVKDGKLFFSLPGNPVSALTLFVQLVRPALLRLMGATQTAKPVVGALLDETITKRRSQYLRLLRGHFVLKDHEFHVATAGDQKSSVLKSMCDANCLIVIPANVERVEAGEKVDIQLIYHDEIAEA